MAEQYKSGFAAIIGRPNVGKSTLMNSLIGQKIAIMSDKPQTTRNKIRCVLTTEGAQVVFIDTPGIHKPKHKLGEYMVDAAIQTFREVDIILFVVDITEKPGPGEEYILDALKDVRTPILLVVNKIDEVPREVILPRIDLYRQKREFAAVVPVSALCGTNQEALVQEIIKYLPEGPQYYPDDMITDQPERLLIAELIREKVLHLTRDEIPHAIAVDIEEIAERPDDKLYVRAVIYVERDSQKGIVIGAKGSMLKEVGKQARADVENLLGSKVFLELWVKVKKEWRNREGTLRMLGYE